MVCVCENYAFYLARLFEEKQVDAKTWVSFRFLTKQKGFGKGHVWKGHKNQWAKYQILEAEQTDGKQL